MQWRLTRAEVVTAWAVGLVATALVAGALAAFSDVRGPGTPGVRDGGLVVLWTLLLGVLPAAGLGLPVWFWLARALRRQRHPGLHVAVYGLAGFLLALPINAALFGRLLFPGDSAVADLLALSAPWGVGAAIGRLAVVPSARRHAAASSKRESA